MFVFPTPCSPNNRACDSQHPLLSPEIIDYRFGTAHRHCGLRLFVRLKMSFCAFVPILFLRSSESDAVYTLQRTRLDMDHTVESAGWLLSSLSFTVPSTINAHWIDARSTNYKRFASMRWPTLSAMHTLDALTKTPWKRGHSLVNDKWCCTISSSPNRKFRCGHKSYRCTHGLHRSWFNVWQQKDKTTSAVASKS